MQKNTIPTTTVKDTASHAKGECQYSDDATSERQARLVRLSAPPGRAGKISGSAAILVGDRTGGSDAHI